MTTMLAESSVATLEERLRKGVDLLLEMEQQGNTGRNYERWLAAWLQLLQQYELLQTDPLAA